MKILIVEDEIGNRKNVKYLLEHDSQQAFEFIEADTIKDGITMINKHHPDIVLLDIILSDGSGFSLLKKIN